MDDLFPTVNVSPKRRQVMLVARAVADVCLFTVTDQQARSLRLATYPTRSQANNNPGLIRRWSNHSQVEGFARFPSVSLGVRALADLINQAIYLRKASVLSLFTGHERSDTRPAFVGIDSELSGDEATSRAAALLQLLQTQDLVSSTATVETPLFLALKSGR